MTLNNDSSPPVHVAFGVNMGNLPHLEVVMRSALAAAVDPQRLQFHILFDGDALIAERRIAAWGLPNWTLHLVVSDWSKADMGVFTDASLLRLRLPSVLAKLDRVIYLDADVLVRRDLAQLFEAELGGRPIGAVHDIGLHVLLRRDKTRRKSDSADYLRSVGFDPDHLRYFNSGVLLMDLKRLRETGAEARLLARWDEVRHQLRYKDQCLINLVFGDEIAELDARWNTMVALLVPEGQRNVPRPLRAAARAQLRDPWIVHFSGPEKPWQHFGLPREEMWWAVADATTGPWRRPAPPPRRPHRLVRGARRDIERMAAGLMTLMNGTRR